MIFLIRSLRPSFWDRSEQTSACAPALRIVRLLDQAFAYQSLGTISLNRCTYYFYFHLFTVGSSYTATLLLKQVYLTPTCLQTNELRCSRTSDRSRSFDLQQCLFCVASLVLLSSNARRVTSALLVVARVWVSSWCSCGAFMLQDWNIKKVYLNMNKFH